MSSDWNIVQLGELCRIEIGGTPPRSSTRYWDKNKATENIWLSIADIPKSMHASIVSSAEHLSDEGAARVKLVRAGTLLVSFKLTLGRLAYAGVDLRTNEAIAALALFDKSIVSKKYLYWYLTYFDWAKAAEGEDKVKGKALNKAKLAVLPVLVPPLEEQHRIVAILDEAFAGIATTKVNAKKCLQNAQDLCDFASQKIFDSVDGNDVSLESVAAEDCTLSYGIVQPGDDVGNGLPVVRPVDLTHEVITLDGLKRIDPKLATSYQRTRLQGGELLLCVRGTTGTISVASAELEGANVTRGIVPIRFKPGLVATAFGYHLMKSASVQSQIREKTYGAALMQINIGDLRNVSVKIPSLAKQQELAERLDSLRQETAHLESLYARKLAALDELKQSLLQQAFSGQL